MSAAPRKAEKPLVCFLRLYGSAQKRMRTLCKKFSAHHNDIAMAGTLKEILRLEMAADELSPELAQAASEARKLGLDPIALIRREIAEKISNP